MSVDPGIDRGGSWSWRSLFMCAVVFVALCGAVPWQEVFAGSKKRILIVSSYHREYLWSQETQRGVSDGFINFGYLENSDQVERLTRTNWVESEQVVIQKLWMDTKRKNSTSEIARSAAAILEQAKAFKPDLLLLGDDNAANYIGTQFLDTVTPVVFWGVNIWPLKYGLLDSVERPGHNVTGVYQPGYMREGLEFLVQLLPEIKTLGILADESETSLSKIKEVHRLEKAGKLPVRIVGTVVTNHESAWKKGALELAQKADAIFLTNHNTIKDNSGNPVDQLALGAWYLRHVRKPDIGDEKQFVQEGVLTTADDSGYNQGFEAVRLADQILRHGADPALLPPVAPPRGRLILNRERARLLGIEAILGNPRIEEIIDHSDALKKYPEAP
ncbi:MAG: hypothetical protein HQL92_01860 [Magnetococcales bacterium]|nr:hypothetical protein [Magnetococcales bacterium]